MLKEDGFIETVKNMTAVLTLAGALFAIFKFGFLLDDKYSVLSVLIVFLGLAAYTHDRKIKKIEKELKDMKGTISFQTAILVMIIILIFIFLYLLRGG